MKKMKKKKNIQDKRNKEKRKEMCDKHEQKMMSDCHFDLTLRIDEFYSLKTCKLVA